MSTTVEKILALPEPKRSELIALIVLIAEYEAGVRHD